MPAPTTQEKILQKFYEKHNNQYDYSSVLYFNDHRLKEVDCRGRIG
jgi:hypothetical protein